MKYGLINKKPDKKDWHLGVISSEKELTDGHWDNYLPKIEYQNENGFDTMACVIYSALNCLETLHNRLYAMEVNYSDRFTAKTSGTTTQGNTLHNVAECIRKFYGTVKEIDYPSDGDDWNEYYKPITEELLALGKKFYDTYQVNYEWVDNHDEYELIEVLKIAPLQVTVHFSGVDDNGYYVSTGKTSNHAVMLYGYKLNEYWLIFDHYSQHIKKLAWGFKFGAIMKYKLSKIKTMRFVKVDNKPDVYLVKNQDIIAINGEEDYFNLENNWNAVETITQQELDNYNLIKGKKLYTFIR